MWKKTKIREKMKNPEPYGLSDFSVFSWIFLFFSHIFKGMNKEKYHFIIIVLKFWFQIPSKTCSAPLVRGSYFHTLHLCFYSAAAGTIFETADVYELGFVLLSFVSLTTVCKKLKNLINTCNMRAWDKSLEGRSTVALLRIS